MAVEVTFVGGPTVARGGHMKSLPYAEMHVRVGKSDHLRAVALTEDQLVQIIEKAAQCLRVLRRGQR